MLQDNNLERSPLFLEGWQEFNRIKWGVQPHNINFKAESGRPLVESVVYLNQKREIYIPPLNPHIPVRFQPTITNLPYRIERQWHDMAELLIKEMKILGVADTFGLPPYIKDIRPWQWAGFNVGVKYTYYIDFPFSLEQVHKSLRRTIRSSVKAGFRCERTTRMTDVYSCLLETESRQHFNHRLTLHDLELARELIGDEGFRVYLSYAPNGEPASTLIDIHLAGARAVGWVGGTKRKYLSSGSYQMLCYWVMQDLESAGAKGYDLAGANIPSVAYSKASWGSELVPYYTIGNYSAKQLARWLRSGYKYNLSGKRV